MALGLAHQAIDILGSDRFVAVNVNGGKFCASYERFFCYKRGLGAIVENAGWRQRGSDAASDARESSVPRTGLSFGNRNFHGLSSATRPAGKHALDFDAAAAPLATLKPGEYELVVEAAREVGGREILRIPFKWPAAAAVSASAKGNEELGEVALQIKP